MNSSGGPGFAVWTQTSMLRALPCEGIPAGADQADGCLEVAMAAARGGRESFQILLRTEGARGLRSVRVEAGDLVRADGAARIEATHVQWHQVGFVRIRQARHPRSWVPTVPEGWFPDPLLPVESFDVAADFTQPVWVTLHVPAEALPGEYAGEVTIHADGRPPVPVRLRVQVHDVALAPGAGHFRTSFDLIEGFLEQIHGQPVPQRIARRYGEFLLEHRLNPDHFSRTDPPCIDDLRHYRRLGMNSFCVINMARHRGESIRGGLNSPPEWYTDANWDALDRRMRPFLDALRREKDLWPLAYVHGFDERDIGTHGPAMRRFFGNVRSRWGLPTLTTSHIPTDPQLLADLQVDWLCPIWAQFSMSYDLAKAERARAAGGKVWSYISLDPSPPFPNWRLDSPLMQARTIWWQVFHQKMDGFLYWGLDVWDQEGSEGNDRPIEGPFLEFNVSGTDRYDWLHGDGVLLYPGADGPIGSMRLANIRDGLQDWELLWMLAESTGNVDAAREACLPVASGLEAVAVEPHALQRQRAAILTRLERGC